MSPSTFNLLKEVLKNKHFNVCVDIGCGEGNYGPLYKKHCNFLVGIDHNLGRLSVAKKFSGYDKVIYVEARNIDIDPTTDAVFMTEFIEHLPKRDGEDLLHKISNIPFVVIVTPETFHSFSLKNGHQSHWRETEFQKLGFKTSLITYDFPNYIMYQKGIFAVRG